MRGGHNRFTFDIVKKFIEDNNCQLISTAYINNNTKIKIKCSEDHIWDMTFHAFKNGQRCPICGNKRKGISKKLTYEFVKTEFEKIGYKLLSGTYENFEQKLDYICDNNHTGSISFHNFRSGQRCRRCVNKNIKHTFSFIKKSIEAENYTLLSNFYKNKESELKIICPSGHEYTTSWGNFRSGRRCPVCFSLHRKSLNKLSYEVVTERFALADYILLSKNYINNYQKLDVLCPKKHRWSVSMVNFHNGVRCNKCLTFTSKGESEIYQFLTKYITGIEQRNRQLISPLELDIVIPSKKLAIEYCGLYWHSFKNGKDKKYHLNKLEECNKIGYNLITIFEDEWLHKKDIVKSILLTKLGLTSNSIYARNCEIKEIDSSIARNFCNSNHIQGYYNASIRLGAYYNNELVSVMTFAKPSAAKNLGNSISTYELSRFCSKLNIRIVGIASKMLTYFNKNYTYNQLISYADRRWSNGNLYNTLGFNFSHNSEPSYWYILVDKRVHRFNYRKSMLTSMQSYLPELTEHQIMANEGFNWVYDCGNIKFVKTNGKLA